MNEMHVYSPCCDCGPCRNETVAQRAKWEEARKLCAAHGGNDIPCEICVDVACGADREEPMLHAVGVLLAKAVRQNCSGRAA